MNVIIYVYSWTNIIWLKIKCNKLSQDKSIFQKNNTIIITNIIDLNIYIYC